MTTPHSDTIESLRAKLWDAIDCYSHDDRPPNREQVNHAIAALLAAREPAPSEAEIVEQLAALEHEQWMAWAKTLMEKEDLSKSRRERWSLLMEPYSQLSEEMKKHDRAWARKAFALAIDVIDEIDRELAAAPAGDAKPAGDTGLYSEKKLVELVEHANAERDDLRAQLAAVTAERDAALAAGTRRAVEMLQDLDGELSNRTPFYTVDVGWIRARISAQITSLVGEAGAKPQEPQRPGDAELREAVDTMDQRGASILTRDIDCRAVVHLLAKRALGDA